MIKALLPFLLSTATNILKSKPNSKVFKFLTDEKTKNTIQDFVITYTQVVTELEEEE